MKNVANQFNKIAEKYDSQRKDLIPAFDEFYKTAIDSIHLKNSNPIVLEIGTGTGILTKMFLEKYPNANMDLVDIAEDMLNIAKERLKGNKNLNFHLENIMKFNPKEKKKYDAIISSLAIHHLPDLEKQELYKKIGKWIKTDGIFVNAEIIAGETEYLEKMYQEKDIEMLEKANLDSENKKRALDRLNLDIRSPASLQLKWLKNAGFSHFDCIYKNYSFGVLWAKK
jgi:tRNA (cmo5U34)-methyltransferase